MGWTGLSFIVKFFEKFVTFALLGYEMIRGEFSRHCVFNEIFFVIRTVGIVAFWDKTSDIN
jgi:hypothetical protein